MLFSAILWRSVTEFPSENGIFRFAATRWDLDVQPIQMEQPETLIAPAPRPRVILPPPLPGAARAVVVKSQVVRVPGLRLTSGWRLRTVRPVIPTGLMASRQSRFNDAIQVVKPPVLPLPGTPLRAGSRPSNQAAAGGRATRQPLPPSSSPPLNPARARPRHFLVAGRGRACWRRAAST
jgi:hypothetical protein